MIKTVDNIKYYAQTLIDFGSYDKVSTDTLLSLDTTLNASILFGLPGGRSEDERLGGFFYVMDLDSSSIDNIKSHSEVLLNYDNYNDIVDDDLADIERAIANKIILLMDEALSSTDE